MKDLEPEIRDVIGTNELIIKIYNDFSNIDNPYFLVLISFAKIDHMLNRVIVSYFRPNSFENESEFVDEVLDKIDFLNKLRLVENLTKKIKIKADQDFYKHFKNKRLFEKINKFREMRNIIAHEKDYENKIRDKMTDPSVVINFLDVNELKKEILGIIHDLDYIRAHVCKEA